MTVFCPTKPTNQRKDIAVKTNRNSLTRGRQRAGIGILLLTAFGLLAGPLAPTQAFVIDDFEHGRKFMHWGDGGQPETSVVDGQLKVRLPSARSWAVQIYRQHMFELPEEQPVQFSYDLVSANAGDVYATINVYFATPPLLKTEDRLYTIYVMHGRVVMEKIWGNARPLYADSAVTFSTAPKTLSLTLTRQGPNMKVGAKVVLRDDPQKVIFSRTITDRPTGAEGPARVAFACGRTESALGAEIVVDNLACSADPSPHSLSIQRATETEATLAWPGHDIALESDSPLGPWRPCPEPVKLGTAGYVCTVPLTGSARYFRPVMGYHIIDTFDGGTQWPWVSRPVVPGGPVAPAWLLMTDGRGRILGTGARNQDFMLRWGAGIRYRDCVSTVDILDWGDDMADATFGLLLRANPGTELWYSTTPGLPHERYAGLLTFKKADNPAESALSITGPGGELLKEQRFPAVNPDKQYRLRFWAVGDQLTLEVFDRENLAAPVQAVTVTDGRIPEGMDGMCGTKSAGETYGVILDQFLFTGATVY